MAVKARRRCDRARIDFGQEESEQLAEESVMQSTMNKPQTKRITLDLVYHLFSRRFRKTSTHAYVLHNTEENIEGTALFQEGSDGDYIDICLKPQCKCCKTSTPVFLTEQIQKVANS